MPLKRGSLSESKHPIGNFFDQPYSSRNLTTVGPFARYEGYKNTLKLVYCPVISVGQPKLLLDDHFGDDLKGVVRADCGFERSSA